MANERTALVTGANRGIGFEVCQQLGRAGFHVFLTARNEAAGSKAAAQLADQGIRADFLPLDVTHPDSVESMVAALRTKTNHLDVLINNAGICEDAELSIFEVDLNLVRRTIETNTLAPLLLIQQMRPLILKSPAGRIINVSSGLGALQQMSSGYPGYRLSKAALNALTRIAAAEFASSQVAVNSVSPGWVRTDMGGPSATSSVEEGADTIVWLATEAPQSLTGQFVADRSPIAW